MGKWEFSTTSENSSNLKTNTTAGKTVLKLVKIQSLRKMGLIWTRPI
jgi:hypothetical protein